MHMYKLYDKSISVIQEGGKKLSLVGLTVPLLLENIFILMYGTVSTVILSGYSDVAVSAVGVVQQIIAIATAVMNMVSKGTVIVTSVALGENNAERIGKTEGTGAILTCGISICIGLLMATNSNWLTRMMHLADAVQENAARYCTIIACLFPITALLSYMNNLLICHEHSAKSMMSGMLSNALNAIFFYIVLYRIHLPIDGVSAVAICAGLAQLVGLGVSVTALNRSGCFVKWRLARKTIGDILRMGVPAGMSLLSYSLSQTITTSFITAMGVAVINTKLYVANVVGYTSRISVSLGNAGGILMGRHRGGHRIDSVKKLY